MAISASPAGQHGGVSDDEHDQMMTDLDNGHKHASGQLDQLNSAMKLAKQGRALMDELVTKGDMVQPDDITEAVGKMVGAGSPANVMAQLLSTMPPEGGAALAAWVSEQDQMLAQKELALEEFKKHAEFQAAASGLAHIAGHSISAMRAGVQAQPPVGQAPQSGPSPESGPPPANAGLMGLPQ